MKAKKRRSTVCHNCDSPLEEHWNFCPVCGQANSDNNITFWTLIKEFLDNYLGVDSKMAHSFMPFLFRPGTLTNRFQEGKIKHFIHPVRLYLVMSLFYFFTISYLLSGINFQTFENQANKNMSANFRDFKSDELLMSFSDSAKFSIMPDTLVKRYEGVTTFDAFYDSLEADFGMLFLDTNRVQWSPIFMPDQDAGEMSRMERMHILARNPRVSDDIFLDSLGMDTDDFDFFGAENTAKFKTQIRKIFKNDEGFKGFVLGNLPLMMFLLIPLFAGVLKMIYIRRKHLYIKHVVHALHVHSFAYLMYGISLLVIFKLIDDVAWRGIIAGVFFVGVSTYVYVSFLKVYQQHWFKSLVKFNIVGFVYSIFLQIFFYAEIFISFWYYDA